MHYFACCIDRTQGMPLSAMPLPPFGPQVAERAKVEFARMGLEDRCEGVGGDFSRRYQQAVTPTFSNTSFTIGAMTAPLQF
jgi:hypothetical protein